MQVPVGDDFSVRFTVTENSVAYSWTGATVTTAIIAAGGVASATNFTTTTSTGGILDVFLSAAQTATLGTGTFDYWLKVSKSGTLRTWVAGTLSMVEARYGASSNLTSSLAITTAPSTTLALTSSGAPGAAGATGAAGAAATLAVGTVTTAIAGTAATVTNSGTSAAAVFNFVLPAGANNLYLYQNLT